MMTCQHVVCKNCVPHLNFCPACRTRVNKHEVKNLYFIWKNKWIKHLVMTWIESLFGKLNNFIQMKEQILSEVFYFAPMKTIKNIFLNFVRLSHTTQGLLNFRGVQFPCTSQPIAAWFFACPGNNKFRSQC